MSDLREDRTVITIDGPPPCVFFDQDERRWVYRDAQGDHLLASRDPQDPQDALSQAQGLATVDLRCPYCGLGVLVGYPDHTAVKRNGTPEDWHTHCWENHRRQMNPMSAL